MRDGTLVSLDTDVGMRDGTQNYLDADVEMRDGTQDIDVEMRVGTQDYLDTDVIMKDGMHDHLDPGVEIWDGTPFYLEPDVEMRDDTRVYLNDDIITGNHEEDISVFFQPYRSGYSPTSSTSTLVDEDIVMTNINNNKKANKVVSMDYLTAMFHAMDLNAKNNRPLICTLCVRPVSALEFLL
jgi:hypothetical protein